MIYPNTDGYCRLEPHQIRIVAGEHNLYTTDETEQVRIVASI